MSLHITIAQWTERGRYLDLPDGRVWVLDSAGASDPARPPVLVLHGFPTCSWDFRQILPLVDRRIILFDFPGYGLSDKPPTYGYSLFEQADVATQVARELGLSRAHLWAHDMGTSVATELLARRKRHLLPFELASVALMNGSVILELAHLTPSQRILRSPWLGPIAAQLSNRLTFELQMRRVFAIPPEPDELAVAWMLLSRHDGRHRVPAIIRYLDERKQHRFRWVNALRQPDLAKLIAWGLRDPVAVPAIADALCVVAPHAVRADWPELGHYPQIEDPRTVARTLTEFWTTEDQRAAVAP